MSVEQDIPCVEQEASPEEPTNVLDVLRWAVQEAMLTGEPVDAIVARRYPEMIGRYAWAPNFCDGSH